MEMSLVGEISPVLDLVHAFKQQFLIFKQYYIYFDTFFYLRVFQKKLLLYKTVTHVPNGLMFA